jgi:hypothetical protein
VTEILINKLIDSEGIGIYVLDPLATPFIDEWGDVYVFDHVAENISVRGQTIPNCSLPGGSGTSIQLPRSGSHGLLGPRV